MNINFSEIMGLGNKTKHFPDLTVLEAVIYYETQIKSKYGSYTMLTREGEITMIYDKSVKSDELVLYRIYLKEEFQRKGILTNLVRHFLENTNYQKICVCASEGNAEKCLSKISYMGRSFYNQGGDFVWKRPE